MGCSNRTEHNIEYVTSHAQDTTAFQSNVCFLHRNTSATGQWWLSAVRNSKLSQGHMQTLQSVTVE